MKRAAIIAVLFTGCLLDPTGQINHSSLRVDVSGLSGGADLVVTATDAKGNGVVRKNPLSGQTALEVVFVSGALADGAVTVTGVVHDAGGKEIACGSASGTVATGARIAMPMNATGDVNNCGACGQACAAGEKCGAGTCSCADGFVDLDGLPGNGCEYACTATGGESDEASCTDGVDNDCNGVKDCDEDACLNLLRSCAFMSCTGQQQFVCATKSWGMCQANNSGESDPVACNDNNDNDCDGLTDCMDPGCNGITRSCPFMSCTGEQTWDCASKSWGACTAPTTGENTVVACSDGQDNDCDGLFDCMDPDCQGLTQTCPYQTCTGQQTWDCSSKTWSACAVDPSLEASVGACKDGKDNDCDGKTDCNDPGCQDVKVPCGADVCAAGLKLWICLLDSFDLCVPYVPVAENSALVCDDNLDNDCDGKTDCIDTGCTGKKCATGKVCCADGGCDTVCN